MDTFIQLTLNGLTLGSVYALIALGYSLVYGILKLLNFAHGDVFMVGSFIGFGMLQLLGGSADPVVPVWLLLIVITLAAMAGCAVLGVAIERFAYRPLRRKRAPRIAPLISALGVSFCLQQLAVILFGSPPKQYDSFAFDGGSFFEPITVGPFRIQRMQLFVIVLGVVLMALLTVFVARTQTGRAMRATSFDIEAASMMGIDVDRVIVVTFFIGSALAGAAGVFNGIAYQQVWPYMGFQAGLFAFTAAVLGGIGNLPGSVLGGLLIGLAEAFATGYISSTFQQAIVFAILIAVMLVRPSGLLGRAAVQKV
jgi:branched-chain amino acid transport system permease protein